MSAAGVAAPKYVILERTFPTDKWDPEKIVLSSFTFGELKSESDSSVTIKPLSRYSLVSSTKNPPGTYVENVSEDAPEETYELGGLFPRITLHKTRPSGVYLPEGFARNMPSAASGGARRRSRRRRSLRRRKSHRRRSA